MIAPDADLVAALAPVRAALRAAAHADATAMTAAAVATAAQTLDKARARADRVRAEARQQGQADAAAALAVARAHANRRARAVVLAARREAYESLGAQARAAVRDLSDEPDYAVLRDRLVSVARAALGPAVRIRDADGGGIVGEVPGRRVDLSLAGFADRAVAAVAAAAEATEADLVAAEPVR